jgi:hypothetical protein
LAVKAEQKEVSGRAERYAAYFSKTTPSADLVRKIGASSVGAACSVAGCVARNIGAETQAFFLMATLAVIEGTKQHYELAEIKKEHVSLDEVAQTSGAAVDHVLASSEIWAGTGGMLAANVATRIPINAWNAILAKATTRALLREFLVGATANLIGFIGFDGASELVNRAILMIPGEEDREKASRLVPTLWESFITKDAKVTENDRRIAALVRSNIYEILVRNDQLRESWWSFAVRNRYQTGNFVVGVTFMSTGAIAGARVGAFLPNPVGKAMTFAIGAAFGVASGYAVSRVSPQHKDKITEMFQSSNMSASQSKIENIQSMLKEEMRSLIEQEQKQTSLPLAQKWRDWRIQQHQERVTLELKLIDSEREKLMTSFYDRIHLLNSKLYTLDNKIQIAKEYRNNEAERAFQAEFNEYAKVYQQSIRETDARLSSEQAFLQTFAQQISVKTYAEEMKSRAEKVKALRGWTYQYVNNIRSTAKWFLRLGTDDGSSLMSEQENQRLLEKIYLWGFKQDLFLQTMEFNN